ncbi:MAG: hypothetical protein IJD14_05515 [Christensenellaceae bacterium]|nr:hypothetical protein [Christensenellaceae bacterium]
MLEIILAVFGLIAEMIWLFAVLGTVFVLLMIIARWRLFKKAGVGGWKSIVPVYNVYTLFKIAWRVKYFWVMIIFQVLSVAITVPAIYNGREPMFFIKLLSALLMVITQIISVLMNFKLSRAYGHGFFFGLMLWIFPTLFTLILGLGGSKYVGPINKNPKRQQNRIG